MPIDRVAVVIPARDEGERLAACLESVRTARRRLLEAAAPAEHAVRVTTVLVLDGCGDGSAAVAARFDDVTTIEIDARNVGAARSVGVRSALLELGGDPTGIWIASTDADSTVPSTWLLDHLEHADAGADVVLGSVVPVRAELSAAQVVAWDHTHPEGAARGTVHGANLGVRASAYLAAGGYDAIDAHEDVALVAALRRITAAVIADESAPVVTSGRSHGRAPGGYAAYLRSLTWPAGA